MAESYEYFDSQANERVVINTRDLGLTISEHMYLDFAFNTERPPVQDETDIYYQDIFWSAYLGGSAEGGVGVEFITSNSVGSAGRLEASRQ